MRSTNVAVNTEKCSLSRSFMQTAGRFASLYDTADNVNELDLQKHVTENVTATVAAPAQ